MPANCQRRTGLGLFSAAPDTNRGYLYGYNCAGEYSLTIWDGKQTTTLVSPRRDKAILTGNEGGQPDGLNGI